MIQLFQDMDLRLKIESKITVTGCLDETLDNPRAETPTMNQSTSTINWTIPLAQQSAEEYQTQSGNEITDISTDKDVLQQAVTINDKALKGHSTQKWNFAYP